MNKPEIPKAAGLTSEFKMPREEFLRSIQPGKVVVFCRLSGSTGKVTRNHTAISSISNGNFNLGLNRVPLKGWSDHHHMYPLLWIEPVWTPPPVEAPTIVKAASLVLLEVDISKRRSEFSMGDGTVIKVEVIPPGR